jgi:hypothetical protein
MADPSIVRGPNPDPNNRIGTYDYRVIVDSISEAYDLGKEALYPLTCAWNNIENADINTRQRQKTELQSYLRRTYALIIFKHLDSSHQQSLLNAISALNNHVLDKYGEAYGYQDLDEFLIDQFLSVPITYALLSTAAGQTITIVGESRARWKDINILWSDITLPMNRIGWENL